MAKAPKVTEETAAPVVTSEVTEEEVYISPATRAEMEAGKAALKKQAESAKAE